MKWLKSIFNLCGTGCEAERGDNYKDEVFEAEKLDKVDSFELSQSAVQKKG